MENCKQQSEIKKRHLSSSKARLKCATYQGQKAKGEMEICKEQSVIAYRRYTDLSVMGNTGGRQI